MAMRAKGSSLESIDELQPNPLETNTAQMLDEND